MPGHIGSRVDQRRRRCGDRNPLRVVQLAMSAGKCDPGMASRTALVKWNKTGVVMVVVAASVALSASLATTLVRA